MSDDQKSAERVGPRADGVRCRHLWSFDTPGAGALCVRFVVAMGEAGDAVGHHAIVPLGNGYVDLKLSSDDAIYREDDGTEHVVAWPTQ